MRWCECLLILLATALPLFAEDWTTADGKTYHDVIVVSQEEDGLRVTYTGGAGKIVNYELPLDVQKKYGLDYASLDAKRLAAEKELAAATTDDQRADAEEKIELATAGMKLLRQQGYGEGVTTLSTNNPAGQPVSPQPSANPSGSPAATPLPSGQTNAATVAPQGQPSTAPAGAQASNPAPPKPALPKPPITNSPAAQPLPLPPLAPATADNPYPGANYSYDSSQDISTLESPPVSVWAVSPDLPPPTPTSPSQGTLTMRMTSESQKPEATDILVVTFHLNTDIKSSPQSRMIRFMVDGVYIHPKEILVDNGSHAVGGDPTVRNITFELTKQQAKSIFKEKSVYFNVGGTDYLVDEAGVSTLERYLNVVDELPVAPKDFLSALHHFISRIPTIITLISTICTYIILGGFALVAILFICAFFVALVRFIKM